LFKIKIFKTFEDFCNQKNTRNLCQWIKILLPSTSITNKLSAMLIGQIIKWIILKVKKFEINREKNKYW
jgi:hypothetical protein